MIVLRKACIITMLLSIIFLVSCSNEEVIKDPIDTNTVSPTPSSTPVQIAESKYNLYVLSKFDSNIYNYGDCNFRLDEDGLWINRNGKYEILCATRADQQAEYQANTSYDFVMKYEQAFDKLDYLPEFINYICSYENYDYFEIDLICGGGSGEFWGSPNSGIYLGINQTTQEVKEFDFRAGYCTKKDDWVYFLDVFNVEQDRSEGLDVGLGQCTPIGYPCRMRPDGSEKQILSNDIVDGSLWFHNKKIYYISYPDMKLKCISEDGLVRYYTDNEIVIKRESLWYPLYPIIGISDHYILIIAYDDKSCKIALDDLSNSADVAFLNDFEFSGVITWDDDSFVFSTIRNDNC